MSTFIATNDTLYDVLLFEPNTGKQVGRRYNCNSAMVQQIKDQFTELTLKKTLSKLPPEPKPEPAEKLEEVFDA
jgi:hypothetical protein